MADIISNLVAHWKLDETSGTSAADSSGNGYTGTYTNSPTLNVAGAFSGSTAVTFASASSQCVGATAPSSLSSGSISAWVYSTAGNSAKRIASLRLDGSNWLIIYFVGGDSIGGYMRIGGTTNLTTSQKTLSENAWHHVVITWTTSRIDFYVDTVAAATPATGTWTTPAFTSFTIAADGGLSGYFDGTIDDVRIYSRALSAADVAALYAYTGFLPFIVDDCE